MKARSSKPQSPWPHPDPFFRALYEETGNAIHVWRAFVHCPVTPQWVWSYLFEVKFAILDVAATPGLTAREANEGILRALGFAGKKQGATGWYKEFRKLDDMALAEIKAENSAGKRSVTATAVAGQLRTTTADQALRKVRKFRRFKKVIANNMRRNRRN